MMRFSIIVVTVMLIISLSLADFSKQSVTENQSKIMIDKLRWGGAKGDDLFLQDLVMVPNQIKVWRKKAMQVMPTEANYIYPDYMHQFFHYEELKAGNVIPLYFEPAFNSYPHFLPKSLADHFPFSSHEIPSILSKFKLLEGTKGAKAVKDALKDCERQPPPDVTQFCVGSFEAMIDKVHQFFGPKKMQAGVKVVSSSVLPSGTKFVQNYTVTNNPRKLAGGHNNMLACHFVPYPYALFFCHEPEGRNVVQEVSLLGADGVKLEAVTSCHMDTKSWTPNVEAFSFLGTKPGSPVCHISPHYDLVWVSGN